MKVYRVSKTQYATDLEGTGSKLFGGRWNHIDFPCIYTSDSRALSILEYAVNANIDFIPRALSLCVFEIDEDQIFSLDEAELPGNWKAVPAPKSTKDYGTELLRKKYPVVKIPSIIIPDEFNYILNPWGQDVHIKLLESNDFVFDLRIKKNDRD